MFLTFINKKFKKIQNSGPALAGLKSGEYNEPFPIPKT